MTGFSSLNTALTGLTAAQRAMDIAGQNVVNANTPGYSRQRVELSSSGATSSATFHTGNRALFGGVTVDGIVRVRDAFLEGARADAGARLASLTSRTSVLTGAEQLLSEPGETGLQQVMDDFFASWHDLAARPSDTAAGVVVLQRAEAAAEQIRSLSSGLADRWGSARADLEAVVVQANQAAADLAELNGKIREGTVTGRPVNELLDQRDQLVRHLGELVGASAVPGEEGMVSVSVNGIGIVSGTSAQTLTLEGATALTGAAADPPHLAWGSVTVPVVSGRAGGLLTALGSDLPGMSAQVDGVAVALRDMVNTQHAAGFTLAGAAGGTFFSGAGAADLTVALTSATDLAVANVAGTVDGTNALALGDLGDDRAAQALLGGPGPSARWRDLAATTGTTVQSLERAVTVQEAVVSTADGAVESSAGVNLDEEMTGMLLFQRAYQASARVITTVDEMLDTLINRTGLVGR